MKRKARIAFERLALPKDQMATHGLWLLAPQFNRAVASTVSARNQRILWLIPIAFSLGCIDLTPPWDKAQLAFDAACSAENPGCAHVEITGGNSEVGAGGSDHDGSSTLIPGEPKDAAVGCSSHVEGPGGCHDAPVVAGRIAASGAAGSGGTGGDESSIGNHDAAAAGTSNTGGIVATGGMAGASASNSGGAGTAGAVNVPDAGTTGTGGIVVAGAMGGSSARNSSVAGSTNAHDAAAGGTTKTGGSIVAGAKAGSTGGSSGGAGADGSTATGCQGLADCAPNKICNSGKCVAPQGMVVLTVPLSASGQSQRFAYPFSPAADLTNKTVTLRVYAPDASAGTLSVYFSMANSASTAGAGVLVPLRDHGGAWKDIVLNVGGVAGSFDPSLIKQVTIEVVSNNSGPWKNPTVVYIDFIAISSLTLGNTFDSSIGTFMQSSAQAIAGSTLTWTGALP